MHGECSVVNKNQTLNVNNGSYHRDVHGFKSFKKDWAVPRQEVYQVERQIFFKKRTLTQDDIIWMACTWRTSRVWKIQLNFTTSHFARVCLKDWNQDGVFVTSHPQSSAIHNHDSHSSYSLQRVWEGNIVGEFWHWAWRGGVTVCDTVHRTHRLTRNGRSPEVCRNSLVCTSSFHK